MCGVGTAAGKGAAEEAAAAGRGRGPGGLTVTASRASPTMAAGAAADYFSAYADISVHAAMLKDKPRMAAYRVSSRPRADRRGGGG